MPGSALAAGTDDGAAPVLPGQPDLPARSGRVLVVAPQPFYTDRGTPIAVLYVVRALSELGYTVDLLTFPLGREIAVPRVTVLRSANPIGARSLRVGFSLAKLALDLPLAWRLRRLIAANDYRCVHAVEEAALLAALLRGRRDLPLIYDMASSLPEQLAQKPLFRAGPLQALFRAAERFLLARAAFVVCSAGLGPHVRRLRPAAAMREWRFPAEPAAAGAGEVAALRRELDVPVGAPVVLYSGTFETYQGMAILTGSVGPALARRPDAVFVLVGARDAAHVEATLEAVGREHARSVRCLVRQPRERIGAFLGLADILVSPRSYGFNFPLKLFDYLASGKPIVATDVAAHRAVLDETLAELVEPTPEGLAGGILRLLDDPARAAAVRAGARAFARRELTWPSFVALIDRMYATAIAARRPAA
jgi:glycosyltransferase involved in cell wall biosynthesis